jgi:cysteine-rich repeat protein
MTSRKCCTIALLALLSACGTQRVGGHVEEQDTSGTTTAEISSATEDATSSESSGDTPVASSATMGTDSGSDDTTDSTGDTAVTGSGTGEPMTECGNGVLEAFGLEPEECDDNNVAPDDGCSETCALDRRVFVTSTLYKGAAVGSLKSGDAQCANLADDQGWPDSLKYPPVSAKLSP